MTHLQVFSVWSFLLGLALGSFYNVCIVRYLKGQSVVTPGSHCPKCGHKLSWWENIPLLSYLMLLGRCRGCRTAISPRYPFVELISGLWALGLAFRFGPSWDFLVLLILGGGLIVMTFIDLEIYILPDIINLPMAALGIPAAIFLMYLPWQESLIGAAVGSGLFLLIQQFYARVRKIDALGTGDVKLMLTIGGVLGWKALPLTILMSAVFALFGSIYYMRKNPGDGMRTMLPFGPFLALGFMIHALYGPDIIRWYQALLGR